MTSKEDEPDKKLKGPEKESGDEFILKKIQSTHKSPFQIFYTPTSNIDQYLHRLRWLLILIQGHEDLMKNMDDELGLRLLALAETPLELLRFEFENFADIAGSGKPFPFTELFSSYTAGGSIPVNFDLRLFCGRKNENANVIVGMDTLFKALFGTLFQCDAEIDMSKRFREHELQVWPENRMAIRVYAIWIGPTICPQFRQYRVDVTKLWRPSILENFDKNCIVGIAQALMKSRRKLVPETSHSEFDYFLNSINDTNAEFVIAMVLSPYQAVQQFIQENFANEATWTSPSPSCTFTNGLNAAKNSTLLVRLQKDQMFGVTNEGNEDKCVMRYFLWLDTAPSSLRAQYNLILETDMYSKCEKNKTFAMLNLQNEFEHLIRCCFSVLQYMEHATRTCGSFPSFLIGRFLSFLNLAEENSERDDHFWLEVWGAWIKNVPIEVQLAYIEVYLNKHQENNAISTIMLKNSDYVKECVKEVTEKHDETILATLPDGETFQRFMI